MIKVDKIEALQVVTPDQDTLRQLLTRDVTLALELDRESPEFKKEMLGLMDQLEEAREKLGPFCATVWGRRK